MSALGLNATFDISGYGSSRDPSRLLGSNLCQHQSVTSYCPGAKSAFCQSNSIPFGMSFGEDLQTMRIMSCLIGLAIS
jgi:hypothetical protein